jgi:hypothetical protein
MKQLWLALGLAAALTSSANAEVWVNPGFYSHHFAQGQNLNNRNHGLGVEVSITDTYSLTAGVFENSDYATSRYLGAYVMPLRMGAVKAGLAVGALNGYPRMHEGGWFPAVVPTLALEGQRVGLNVSFIPKFKDSVSSALAFQLKFKLMP